MNITPHEYITVEAETDDAAVEALCAAAFGPGRFTRTAFRLREGVPHEPELSFVYRRNGSLLASVRLTKILIGGEVALVLGPLVVDVSHKSRGYGAALMQRAVDAARDAGHSLILLVGDEPYYGRFGFKKVPYGAMEMPGPVDPDRLLYCPLNLQDGELLKGAVRPFA